MLVKTIDNSRIWIIYLLINWTNRPEVDMKVGDSLYYKLNHVLDRCYPQESFVSRPHLAKLCPVTRFCPNIRCANPVSLLPSPWLTSNKLWVTDRVSASALTEITPLNIPPGNFNKFRLWFKSKTVVIEQIELPTRLNTNGKISRRFLHRRQEILAG